MHQDRGSTYAQHWARRADAVILVTPEYNYGYPAAPKNAIDYLHREWQDKPVGFVSYGGIATGTRAVQQLKQVLTTLKMVPVLESVNIPFLRQFIDDEGHVRAGGRSGAPRLRRGAGPVRT